MSTFVICTLHRIL